jgi:hypothetical protein
MKKKITVLLIFSMMLCLTSCDSEPVINDADINVGNGITEIAKEQTETANQSIEASVEAEPSVLINGEDVTSNLQLKTIDGVLYAEGKSFIDSFFVGAEGPNEYFYEYNEMGEVIFISSFATDVVIFRLYINNTTAEQLDNDFERTYRNVELAAPALYQDDMVWIPVEAFHELNNEVEVIQ